MRPEESIREERPGDSYRSEETPPSGEVWPHTRHSSPERGSKRVISSRRTASCIQLSHLKSEQFLSYSTPQLYNSRYIDSPELFSSSERLCKAGVLRNDNIAESWQRPSLWYWYSYKRVTYEVILSLSWKSHNIETLFLSPVYSMSKDYMTTFCFLIRRSIFYCTTWIDIAY